MCSTSGYGLINDNPVSVIVIGQSGLTTYRLGLKYSCNKKYFQCIQIKNYEIYHVYKIEEEGTF